MAKDPAVLWYWNDWQGGTITFSRHLKGCYMDLLHAQFNNGRLSLSEIKTVLGVDFGATWLILVKKFKQDENGKFYNEKAEAEKTKRVNFSLKQRNNRLGKTKSKPDNNLLENENENTLSEVLKKEKVEEKISEILNSQVWIEDTARVQRVKTESVTAFLVDFLNEQRIKEEIYHRELNEIKSHFFNWLKKQLLKPNGTNKTNSKGDDVADIITRLAGQ